MGPRPFAGIYVPFLLRFQVSVLIWLDYQQSPKISVYCIVRRRTEMSSGDILFTAGVVA